MFSKQCKLQLEAENKSRSEHFRDAVKTAVTFQLLVPALLVHAVAPRFFAKMSDKAINRDMSKHRAHTSKYEDLCM